MNMELIRKQLEEITPPEMRFKQHVLQQIRIRRQIRKRNMQISAAVVLLVAIIGTVQFQQITAMAENVYRSIQILLHNETLVIDNNLEMIPIEVNGLTWVGKQPNRVGYKSYTDINAAEDELKIKLLHNTMSNESAVDFGYFEKRNMAELLLRYFFIGDLKNFSETILENGDRQHRYSADHDTVYKSPVNMKVSFFTGRGAEYEMDNLDTYNYEEKYISPVNGITAYLLKDTFQATSDESSLLMYAAGSITEKLTVFVHDNLLYTIYGNIPSSEMKKIIDAFVIEK
ncbi:hypothetical protein PAT3040_02213 [Paenibacillus agaridevorans]|uniref:DUF4367 domain-containing protein n=1 Tax=Paenibacillus agaridevorans TaxID=171404 RepID=A0A2R5EM68_9BACL|nr:hypothetical protein [Paenibacillus agaridevorans]GBG07657.1 hypothetical protein PAT3040_02213 [Paenibacillus agaridevorans]